MGRQMGRSASLRLSKQREPSKGPRPQRSTTMCATIRAAKLRTRATLVRTIPGVLLRIGCATDPICPPSARAAPALAHLCPLLCSALLCSAPRVEGSPGRQGKGPQSSWLFAFSPFRLLPRAPRLWQTLRAHPRTCVMDVVSLNERAPFLLGRLSAPASMPIMGA